MADPKVKHHYAIALFQPGEANNGIGVLGQPEADLWDTVDAAKTRAKELAALNPGNVFVVYEAHWYAFTDITPVNLLRVVSGATS